MPIRVVPHTVTTNQANLWLAAPSAAPPVGLPIDWRPKNGGRLLDTASWRPVTAGDTLTPAESGLYVKTVELGGLSPATSYEVTDSTNGSILARFRTLPTDLPDDPASSFRVLLASCYARDNDDGAVGMRMQEILRERRPDMNVLCGDQVYLDTPPLEDFPDDSKWLAKRFLQDYCDNWDISGLGRPSLKEVLINAANYFASDDHEFWNNYPDATFAVNNSWSQAGRDRWKRVAAELFKDFQSDDPARAGKPRRFNVGRVSFYIADTRFNR